jgi:sulfur carrier protein ThiS adenylyltransferase
MLELNFEEITARLRNKTVGIAGAGGLGSNCAVALARTGIGKLIIADFDIIKTENLNSQYFFTDQVGQKKVYALRDIIKRINPGVEVEVHDLKLEPGNIGQIFKSCNIIVEAFDMAEMKKMLVETVIAEMADKFLILGSGIAGFGNNSSIKTTNTGNIYICGDQENKAGSTRPPLAPKVGIVANMQANQVLELLLMHSEI